MALSQSALSELLEAFRAGEGVDLIRDSVRVALQELIELEATERIGAAPYERTEDRANERNGHRPRALTTKAGDVELRIPKLRKGSFMPVILQLRRRIDQALYAVVMEAYVHGVSTRSVDDLVEAMGGAGISKSQVSRICAGLDETVGAFRTRTLAHVDFPYVNARRRHPRADRRMGSHPPRPGSTAHTPTSDRGPGNGPDEDSMRGQKRGRRIICDRCRSTPAITFAQVSHMLSALTTNTR